MVKKTKEKTYFEAVGRRKTAVVRVRLYMASGKDKTVIIGSHKAKQGEFIYNGKKIEDVFPAVSQKTRYLQPLKLTSSEDRYVVSAIGKGGGQESQLEALILGMARSLEKVDRETYRPPMKKEGLLLRDPRGRQRRKVGTGGKARRAKQSPKR